MAHAHPSKDMHLDSSLDHQEPSEALHNNTWRNSQYSIILNLHLQATYQHEHCRLLAHGYRIFCMECCSSSLTVLDSWSQGTLLSSAIEQVYNAFFYSTSTHLLCQWSDKTLFGHFWPPWMLHVESKLALEDKGYESSGQNFNIPTPLRRTSKIHHISTVKKCLFWSRSSYTT